MFPVQLFVGLYEEWVHWGEKLFIHVVKEGEGHELLTYLQCLSLSDGVLKPFITFSLEIGKWKYEPLQDSFHVYLGEKDGEKLLFGIKYFHVSHGKEIYRKISQLVSGALDKDAIPAKLTDPIDIPADFHAFNQTNPRDNLISVSSPLKVEHRHHLNGERHKRLDELEKEVRQLVGDDKSEKPSFKFINLVQQFLKGYSPEKKDTDKSIPQTFRNIMDDVGLTEEDDMQDEKTFQDVATAVERFMDSSPNFDLFDDQTEEDISQEDRSELLHSVRSALTVSRSIRNMLTDNAISSEEAE